MRNGFNFKKIAANEVKKISLQDIYNKKVDGVIIKNLLSRNESNRILDLLKKANKNYNNPNFLTYPTSFSKLQTGLDNNTTSINSYLKNAKIFFDSFPFVYNTNVLNQLLKTFSIMNSKGEAKRILSDDGANYLNPVTFRIIPKNHERFTLHCGNLFVNQFPEGYSQITKTVQVLNQLSFFLMLQEPEEGGKLRVYNKTREEAKKYNDRNNTLISEDGKEISLDDSSEIERIGLGLETGDLLIFQGGRLWHRVEKVLGIKKE